MKALYYFIALLSLPAIQQASAQSVSNPELRNELLQMRDADQAGRKAIMKLTPQTSEASNALLALDARHTARLKQIIVAHGWPSVSVVGKDGAKAAWLLAQHADADPAFQRQVLQLMEPLLEAGEVKAADFAYLWDRTHEPQRYGTQGSCVNEAKWEPREIEFPDEVDSRRAEMGLPPMEHYEKLVSGICRRGR